MSLPIMPEESSKVWYANARLGVSCWCVYIWGEGQPPKGSYITIFTRVMEHSSELSISLLRVAMEKMGPKGPGAPIKTICWISDTGPHFRSYRVLGTQCVHFTAESRCNQTVM